MRLRAFVAMSVPGAPIVSVDRDGMADVGVSFPDMLSYWRAGREAKGA
jgi:hypothetical protein